MNDTVNDSSSKKKVIIGIITAIIVLLIIGCGIFALNKGSDNSSEPDTYSIVSDTSENSIRFKDTSLTLKVGETVTLEIIFESEYGSNADVEFESVDPAVADVDEQGRITGIASGSTVVNASLKSDNAVTASLNVTVTDDDTDTSASENKTVEKSSDTVSSKKESEKSTDTKTQSKAENTSSASSSGKPDSDKENVSSAASKIEVVSSGTAESRTVSTGGTITSNNTVSQTVNANSATENTSTQTEEKNNYSSEVIPNTSEFIDPYSVGKSIPISYVGTEEKKVSVSFDASWGNDKTQTILDTLERYNIKSTFFLVGIWVRAYPDDVKKIAAAGHDIGNHSNTHPDLTQLDIGSIKYELETCSGDIEALTGNRPTLFRPPYGAYDNRLIGTALGMGMNCIQWDIDTLDWTNNSGAEICERIRSRIRNGSIILMHNAGGNTADSLPMIIDTIHNLGYEIVPISELLPAGDYTTDMSGRLIPENPPLAEPTDIPEDSDDTKSENNSSQSVVETNEINSES